MRGRGHQFLLAGGWAAGAFEHALGAVLERGLDRVAAERAPIGILGLDDPLDRAHPVVEPAGEVVKLVEQILVLAWSASPRSSTW